MLALLWPAVAEGRPKMFSKAAVRLSMAEERARAGRAGSRAEAESGALADENPEWEPESKTWEE